MHESKVLPPEEVLSVGEVEYVPKLTAQQKQEMFLPSLTWKVRNKRKIKNKIQKQSRKINRRK